jgi:hypothetical protein
MEGATRRTALTSTFTKVGNVSVAPDRLRRHCRGSGSRG